LHQATIPPTLPLHHTASTAPIAAISCGICCHHHHHVPALRSMVSSHSWWRA
jgi:hypothetical protein